MITKEQEHTRDRVRLNVESPLLYSKRSQLGGFGNLVRMPPGCLLREVIQTRPPGRRPRNRPRTHWRDYISQLGYESLRISGWGEEYLGSSAESIPPMTPRRWIEGKERKQIKSMKYKSTCDLDLDK